MKRTGQANDDLQNCAAETGVAITPGCDGLRLLIVDDDTATGNALASLLRLEGAQVWATNSGEQALVAAAEHPLDVVLTDLDMPGMDGYTLLRRLRQLAAMEAVPVVALTGFCRKDDVRRTLAAGFAAQIVKPVRIDALLDLIRRLAGDVEVLFDPAGTCAGKSHPAD